MYPYRYFYCIRNPEERSPSLFAIREMSIVLIWSHFIFESFGRFASPEGIKTSKERITFVLDVSGIMVIVFENWLLMSLEITKTGRVLFISLSSVGSSLAK